MDSPSFEHDCPCCSGNQLAELAGLSYCLKHSMGLSHPADQAYLGKHTSSVVHCVQVLVDPEAAARTKLHKQERRAAGRKRKMEEMHRQRGAGVAVKNKKKHRGADT